MSCSCSQKTNTSKTLATMVSEEEQQKHIDAYRVIPQSADDFKKIAGIKEHHVPIGAKFPSLPFQYVSIEGPQLAPIYTDSIKQPEGGIAAVFLPGSVTPVCSGTHLPSILNHEILTNLKKTGINILMVVTKDTPDVLCSWLRGLVNYFNLPTEIIPASLPEQSFQRVSLHSEYPLIIPFADQDLTFTNMHGLVTEGRLGLMAHRGYVVYQNDKLALHVKPMDSSKASCGPVLGSEMVDAIQSLKVDRKSTVHR